MTLDLQCKPLEKDEDEEDGVATIQTTARTWLSCWHLASGNWTCAWSDTRWDRKSRRGSTSASQGRASLPPYDLSRPEHEAQVRALAWVWDEVGSFLTMSNQIGDSTSPLAGFLSRTDGALWEVELEELN
jgi:hypothetical protein